MSNFLQTASGNGQVSVSGQLVQVSPTSIPCKRVWVQAHPDNANLTPVDGDTGVVLALGGPDVVANKSGRKGVSIYPTLGEWFEVSDVNALWVDANANGAKFIFYAEKSS